jgi:hypothetical protein
MGTCENGNGPKGEVWLCSFGAPCAPCSLDSFNSGNKALTHDDFLYLNEYGINIPNERNTLEQPDVKKKAKNW